MQAKSTIRVIKREQRALIQASTAPAATRRAADPEREMRTVVSGWVRERRQRSEDYKQAFASLFGGK